MKKEKIDQGEYNKETFLENEIAANISFAKSSLIAAIILVVLWACYIAGLFQVSTQTMVLVNIAFPLNIVLYLSCLIYVRTPLISRKGFKYFLLIQFILCIGFLNIVIPKHALLGWAVCLAFACHYYSPKVMKIVFISVLVVSLISLYGGMLIGEWDANLLNGAGTVTLHGVEYKVDDLTPLQRIDYLNIKAANGDNRYLKILYFYYLSRVVVLSILFVVLNALSKRTLKLLKAESAHVENANKMNHELALASSIQLGVLPKDKLDNEYYSISARIDPAKEVGGDFYDFFKIDDQHVAIVVGDVSGKGVPASLYMMKTETLIKSLALSHKNKPAVVMQRCNQLICDGNILGMFVTCWLGILNTVTGELTYCNAGHNPPLISFGKEVIFTKKSKQTVLGAFEDSQYNEESIIITEGDKLFLYTDGVTEAHNHDSILFGEDRLINIVETNIGLSAENLVDKVYQEIQSFSKNTPQFDDITMLCIEYKKAKGDRAKKTYDANVMDLDKVLDFVKVFFKKYGFDDKTINSVGIAVEESFVNVCHYAYKGAGPIDITLIRDDKNDEIFIEMRDMGVPFNPLQREDPDISASSEERDIGGLGIFMVKKIMDDVSYKFINNSNVLILGKKRPNPIKNKY